MGLTGTNKADMGDQDGDPSKKTKDSDQVDEISEYSIRASVNTKVGQEAETDRDTESIDWYTSRICLGENGRSLAFTSETEEGSGSNVKIRIGG